MQKKISKVSFALLALVFFMASTLFFACSDDSAAEAKAAMEAQKNRSSRTSPGRKECAGKPDQGHYRGPNMLCVCLTPTQEPGPPWEKSLRQNTPTHCYSKVS